MPQAFVTGATGFVGSTLVRTLHQEGWDVTACHREGSNLAGVAGVCRWVLADITDAAAIGRAMPEDVDAVFHVAADLSFWRQRNAQQTRTNVDGTRHVVRAALLKRARRFVHTSSFAAWGPAHGDMLEETSPSKAQDHWVNYYRTKWQAEQEVVRGIRAGLAAVIVNPGNILGPGDTRNWGRSLVVLDRGELLAAPPGSGPWCHVADVAQALLAAAREGRVGERYMLGGCQASYREFLALAGQLLGRPPLRTVPRWLLASFARASSIASLFTRRQPTISAEFAHLLTADVGIRSDKAQRELGYRSRPLAQMVADTHAWLLEAGHLSASQRAPQRTARHTRQVDA